MHIWGGLKWNTKYTCNSGSAHPRQPPGHFIIQNRHWVSVNRTTLTYITRIWGFGTLSMMINLDSIRFSSTVYSSPAFISHDFIFLLYEGGRIWVFTSVVLLIKESRILFLYFLLFLSVGISVGMKGGMKVKWQCFRERSCCSVQWKCKRRWKTLFKVLNHTVSLFFTDVGAAWFSYLPWCSNRLCVCVSGQWKAVVWLWNVCSQSSCVSKEKALV